MGEYPTVPLGQKDGAHARRDALRDKLRQGLNPGAERSQERRPDNEPLTFKKLAEVYIERHAKVKKKSWKEDQRFLDRDILPKWADAVAAEIARANVLEILDTIADRGATTSANRVLALLRKIFNFGIQRGLVDDNPCTHIAKPGKESQRDRVLTDDEIRNFWLRIEQCDINIWAAKALKFQLLTAQRGGEVTNAKWADIDLDAGWWTIPAEQSKNGLTHRVPLSRLAVDLLNELSRTSVYVFRSPRWDDKPVRADHGLLRAFKEPKEGGAYLLRLA